VVSISAVLPAYNEQEVIAQTVEAVDKGLARLSDDFEIIVVDDGSRDATAERLAELQVSYPRLRMVTHPHNRGYGSAVASGFSAATKELVFLTDGDKQFDVAELSEFLPLPDDVDLYVGYRQPRADPWIRRFYGWGWNELVRLLFGPTARDVDCAFKLFRREVWERTHVRSTGATFSAELLVKARHLGFRLRERPVRHYPRPAGSPTGARPSVIARAFKELFRLRLSLSRELAESQARHDQTIPPDQAGVARAEATAGPHLQPPARRPVDPSGPPPSGR
jgi:glycosyltransferase involved in cell wall biosynthesis